MDPNGSRRQAVEFVIASKVIGAFASDLDRTECRWSLLDETLEVSQCLLNNFTSRNLIDLDWNRFSFQIIAGTERREIDDGAIAFGRTDDAGQQSSCRPSDADHQDTCGEWIEGARMPALGATSGISRQYANSRKGLHRTDARRLVEDKKASDGIVLIQGVRPERDLMFQVCSDLNRQARGKKWAIQDSNL